MTNRHSNCDVAFWSITAFRLRICIAMFTVLSNVDSRIQQQQPSSLQSQYNYGRTPLRNVSNTGQMQQQQQKGTVQQQKCWQQAQPTVAYHQQIKQHANTAAAYQPQVAFQQPNNTPATYRHQSPYQQQVVTAQLRAPQPFTQLPISNQSAGHVFMCNNFTERECFERCLFGSKPKVRYQILLVRLPYRMWSIMAMGLSTVHNNDTP